MKNKVQVKFLLEFSRSHITDEDIFRNLAKKMVAEMPFEELSKLLKFTKLDPNSSESEAKILDPNISKNERERLMGLKKEQVILYEAEFNS